MSFLLDTNVISELARPIPNAGVLVWARTTRPVAISVVVVEEIHFGLAWKNVARIKHWFERFLDERCQVLPVTPEIARLCGEMRGRFQAREGSQSQADILIAATASIQGLTLVTRNERDSRGTNVAILNPFT